jgi:hypothetical protein
MRLLSHPMEIWKPRMTVPKARRPAVQIVVGQPVAGSAAALRYVGLLAATAQASGAGADEQVSHRSTSPCVCW